MRLRYLIPSLILVLAAGLLGMTGYELVQNWRARSLAERFILSDAARGDLLTASTGWALERGTGYMLSVRAEPVPSDRRDQLSAIAATADGQWQRALAGLQVPELREQLPPQMLVGMMEAHENLRQARADLLAALALPRAARPTHLHERWFAAATALIDQSSRLRFQVLLAVPIDDMRLSSQSWLKQYLWVATEFAGRERALLAGALAGGPDLPAMEASLADARSRFAWAWDGVEALTRTGMDTLDEPVARARQMLAERVGPARHAAMLQLSGEGRPVPDIAAADAWFMAASDGIDAIQEIQKASIALSARQAGLLSRQAGWDLAASAAMLLAVLVLTGLALVLVWRRLLLPLAGLTDLFEKIARGRTDLSVPGTERHDEVGDLARAADAFRETHLDGRRLSEALQRREHLLALFIRHAPTAIAMMDRDMRYLAVSRRWLLDYGLGERDLVGLCHYDVFPEIDERWRAVHRQCLGGRSASAAEDRFLRADGSLTWVRWEIHPWRDADGSVGGIIIFTEGITARKEAEDEIRHLASHLQVMLDSADSAIISTDADGIIQIFNRGAERMLGYRSQELAGRHAPTLFHDPLEVAEVLTALREEGAAVVENTVEALVHDARLGRPSQREWTFIDRDGRRFPVLLSINAIRDTDGTITGFLGIANDISQLREADRLKAEFISTVSHELRTPLTAIRASLGMVNSGMFGELPAEARQLTDIGQQSTERLIRLINDLLDIEKIASGKMRFEMAQHILPVVLRQTLQDNEALAARAGVALRLEVPDGVSATVLADADRLVQTFTNLVSNAIKFSPADSVIRLKMQPPAAGWVRVSVIDSGCGIPAEFRPRIFQRFAQADGSDSRAKGGTGLGLAITREIVERHGGRVSFDTVEGAGTRFHVDLPLMAERLPLRPAADRRAARILVCEDDGDIARLLGLMLAQAGFVPVLARNAAEALRLLAGERFDAMTLDLLLPDMPGLRLFHEVRATEGGRELPVIVVSAMADQGRETLNGEAVGVIDWLAKPIDPDRLIRAVGLAVDAPGPERALLLHIEDDADMRTIVERLLSPHADIIAAPSLAAARHLAGEQAFDVAIVDIDMPDGCGLDVIPLLRDRRGGPVPVVVFTAADVGSLDPQQVAATLVKSRARNDELVETIQGLIQRMTHSVSLNDFSPNHLEPSA